MSHQRGGNPVRRAVAGHAARRDRCVRRFDVRAGQRRRLGDDRRRRRGFYRAFEHVDVAVDDPPDDFDALDVRRGSDAVPELESRALTLADVMNLSADVDGVAAEWVDGFRRSFEAAAAIERRDGPVPDRAAHVFLELLADEVDTFVVTRNDRETAEEVTRRAQAVLDGEEGPGGSGRRVRGTRRQSGDDGRHRRGGPSSSRSNGAPGVTEFDGDADWPVELRGVTESLVTTLGPNDRWNVAVPGLHAPDDAADPVKARTWGNAHLAELP